MNRHKKRSSRTMYTTKAVFAAMAGFMVFGGAGTAIGASAAPAAAAQSASGGAFSDVKVGLWAEKHIYKLAAQGIVIGNNGQFRPNNSVTQQEAVLMALRFMKTDKQADSEAAVVLPEGIEVDNYFKPYVVLAFKQGLLDRTAESGSVKDKQHWGKRAASREWIAELLIRALGKTQDAQAVGAEPTGFADDAKVDAAKRGYINAAVKLGLANGVDGNRFDPKGAVTRAQLATFLSRAQSHTSNEYDNTVTGTVSELTYGKLTLFTDNGPQNYVLGSTTAYFTSTSEKRIAFSDLQPYTKLKIAGKDGVASYVEVTDPNQQVDTLEGTFAMLAPDNIFWLKTPTAFKDYAYNPNAVFLDANGANINPASIAPDSQVTVTRETFTGAHRVVKLQVRSGIVNKTETGTVQSVDTAGKRITFKTAAGSEESFKFDDATVFRSGSQIVTSAELKAGINVKYTIKDNIVSVAEVTQGVERTVQGSLLELTDSSVIYKLSDGTRQVKLLVDHPAFVVGGNTRAVMDDLIADTAFGDNVQVTLNAQDQVSKIEVLSRKMDQFIEATATGFDAKTNLLTIRDKDNKAHLLQLDDKTKLIHTGPQTELKSFGNLLPNRKVNVNAIGDRAILVEIVSKYEGTVTGVSTTGRSFTLKTTDGRSMTLPYPSGVEIFGRTGATIADVPVGSEVTVVLMPNQEVVSALRVKTTVQVPIAAIDAENNRLRVMSGSGVADLYTLGIPVKDADGNPIKITDFVVGMPVNVTTMGSTALAVQGVKITLGQVTAIDKAGGKLTVKGYNGQTDTYSFGGGAKITRAGAVSADIGTLAVGDRVEARSGGDGSVLVNVLNSETRTFSRYESATNEISVKRANTNDNRYRFPLAPNVYIHQGDTTLPVQSLKENDNIVVYFSNNSVVEIVKQ